MEECKKCNTGGSKSMLEKALKWSFITNICLVALIAIIIVSVSFAYAITDCEITYETITTDDFQGDDINGNYVPRTFNG